ELLIDENGERSSGMVGLKEAATAGDGNAHGAEIIRIAGTDRGSHYVLFGGFGLIRWPDVEGEVGGGEGSDGGHADGLDAGRMAELFFGGIVEAGDDVGRLGVAAFT